MKENTSPTALCSICMLVPPKYCCPRCPGAVRTCSLPCYKSHQLRASCNGKRDPAAYVKKSQLATPAAIDRDYNFLTGLQKSLETAPGHEDSSTSRNTTDARHRRPHMDKHFSQYLFQNKITFHRAPVGLSRQKTNMSRFLPKSKKYMWTVEWLQDGPGTHPLVTETASDLTVADSYSIALKERERESKKRKRIEGDTQSINRSVPEPVTINKADAKPCCTNPPPKPVPAASSMDSNVTNDTEADTTPHEPLQPPCTATNDPGAHKNLHYYLFKPRTTDPTGRKVLIPLTGTSDLTTALRTRSVLEYPTFYALHHGPDELPVEFIAEELYLQERNARGEVDDKPRIGGRARIEEVNAPTAEVLDGNAILDMLKRDTSGR